MNLPPSVRGRHAATTRNANVSEKPPKKKSVWKLSRDVRKLNFSEVHAPRACGATDHWSLSEIFIANAPSANSSSHSRSRCVNYSTTVTRRLTCCERRSLTLSPHTDVHTPRDLSKPGERVAIAGSELASHAGCFSVPMLHNLSSGRWEALSHISQ